MEDAVFDFDEDFFLSLNDALEDFSSPKIPEPREGDLKTDDSLSPSGTDPNSPGATTADYTREPKVVCATSTDPRCGNDRLETDDWSLGGRFCHRVSNSGDDADPTIDDDKPRPGESRSVTAVNVSPSPAGTGRGDGQRRVDSGAKPKTRSYQKQSRSNARSQKGKGITNQRQRLKKTEIYPESYKDSGSGPLAGIINPHGSVTSGSEYQKSGIGGFDTDLNTDTSKSLSPDAEVGNWGSAGLSQDNCNPLSAGEEPESGKFSGVLESEDMDIGAAAHAKQQWLLHHGFITNRDDTSMGQREMKFVQGMDTPLHIPQPGKSSYFDSSKHKYKHKQGLMDVKKFEKQSDSGRHPKSGSSDGSESDDGGGDWTIGSSSGPGAEQMDYSLSSDGPCTSSEIPVSSMSSGKKDKLCLVCGDKALGYNFNAVSCESCKAFFRRNAHKVIRGRCEGKCDVTVESRSFCKRCRLAKCFVVGMRKDMILNEEQKKQRKQKIIINKLRRQGQLPPQDTYSASAKDLLSPIRGMVAKNPDQFLAAHSSFSPPEFVIKQEVMDPMGSPGGSIGSPPGSIGSIGPSGPTFPTSHGGHYPSSSLSGGVHYPSGSSTPEAVISYTPWEESQDQVHAAINTMSESDQVLIHELISAMEGGSFLVMSTTSMKMIPTQPEEFVNMAEQFVRKVIKVAKNVAFFKQLHKDDQISLLKGSVVDIMMLRSAVNYDPFTESWSLNTKGCISQGSSQAAGERISAEILKSGSSETKQLFMTYSKFIKALMSTIHGDLLALKLLIVMSLFSADRMPMVDHRKVQEIQETYARILQEYIGIRFNREATLFARIVMKLTDLRNINEVHSKMLLKMKVDEFEPLLLEIFDLPGEAEGKGSEATSSSSSSSAAAPSSSSS